MANWNYYKRKLKTLTLTEILIGLNAIMFVLTFLVNMTIGNALIHLGAKVDFLIAGGQYFRLVTSMFLHADIMHLIFNMMALYILGRDIERFFGRKKYMAIYFGAGLLGSALSYVLIDSISVGASGAIFGLMGANLFLYKKNPMVYKRIYGSDLLILIGVNLLLGFVRPNIDIAGHIGGLIGGFFVAWALDLKNIPWRKPRNILMLTGVTVTIVALVAFGTYQNYHSEYFYMNMTYYEYVRNHLSSAIDWAKKGLSLFPNNAELQNFVNSAEGL